MNLAQRQTLVQKLRADPVYHIENIQGVQTLQHYQRHVAKEISLYDLLAIAACHSVGKTFLASRIALWFGSSFQGAKIITTAPTWLQVEMLLWAEMRAAFARSKVPLGGRMLNTEWKIDDNWYAIGLSPREDADSSGGGQGASSGFQGFHSETGNVLVIFDEATGVPSKRWLQAQGLLTSANVKFLALGNPTTKNCDFYKCFQSRLWRKVHISCFDSPNLIANGISSMEDLRRELSIITELGEDKALERIKGYRVEAPALLSLAWVVDRALVWGVEHPLFVSKALGQFPDEDDHTPIPLGAVEAAQRRVNLPREGERVGIGVDVARYGDDKSVIVSIKGKQAQPPKAKTKRDTMEIAGEVVREIKRHIDAGVHPSLISVCVDCTGIGSGVYDRLVEMRSEGVFPASIGLFEVHFGQGFDYESDDEKADKWRKEYANRKAKLFDELGKAVKADLCLTSDSVYAEELPTIQAKYDSKGRMVIESKEDYRARTGRPSPDYADGLALAYEAVSMSESVVGLIRVVR